MKMITLNTGDKIPAFGLGTWQASADELKRVITAALEMGYRHLDCAAIYKNEATIGAVLAELFQAQSVSREDLWITSKLWNSYHRPEDVEPALKRTLKDLQLDYLDLYLIHWPVVFDASVGLSSPSKPDEFSSLDEVPLETTWQAMEELVKKGLVRNIGVSNCSVKKLDRLMKAATIKPAMNQVECHAYFQQKELVDFCLSHDVQITAYAPLGSGRGLLGDATIKAIAEANGASSAQILLAWLLQRGLCAIPKSTNLGRLEENFAAEAITLSDADMAKINGLGVEQRYIQAAIWEEVGADFSFDQLWND